MNKLAPLQRLFSNWIRRHDEVRGIAIYSMLLSALMVGWIICSATRLTKVARPAMPAPSIKTHINPGRTKDRQQLIQDIVDRHLFGEYIPPPPIDVYNPPEPPLNVQVVGLFSYADHSRSIAILGINGNDPRPVVLGEALEEGWILTDIRSDSIVVQKRGDTKQFSIRETTETIAESEDEGLERHRHENGAVLVAAATAVKSSPAIAEAYIRLLPSRKSDGFHGFRVYPGTNFQAFDATGLHPGDVVASINGVRVTENSGAPQIIAAFGTGKPVQLEIERGGLFQQIELKIGPSRT